MNRLSTQSQLIIAVVVIVVIAVAATFLLIMPQFDKASQVSAQITDTESQIAQQQAVLDRRTSAKARAAENQVELLHIANQVPEGPELPTLIVDLQDVANAAGLTFTQIQPNEPVPAVDAAGKSLGYTRIPISIVVTGDWADHVEYVRKIDKLTRGVRVLSCDYAYVAPTETEGAVIKGVIEIEVYTMSIVQSSRPSSASAPATASPPASATPSQ